MYQAIGAAGVFTLYLLGAVFDERPALMLAGFAPLSLVAAETVWHFIDDLMENRT
jgi:hypothetical protein